MGPNIHLQVHAMRDHPAHNVPLLGASWAAQLSQVLLIRHQKHIVIKISGKHSREMATQLAKDVGRPSLLGASLCQRARPGKEHCYLKIPFQILIFKLKLKKNHHSWQHRHHQPFTQELLTKYIWSWARHMAVGMRVTVIGFVK